MKNNNTKVITKLAKRNMQNKVKTRIMFLSIFLITFMLCTVFSIGFSFYENYQILNTRLQGSTANVSFINPTKKQMKKISTLDYVITWGTQQHCGNIQPQDTRADTMMVMTYYSPQEWSKHILPTISNFQGTLPYKSNDIVMSSWMLQSVGITSPRIGMKVPLTYQRADKKIQETFTLTGWFEDYILGTNQTTRSANVASSLFYYQTLDQSYQCYGNTIVSETFAKRTSQKNTTTLMLSLKNRSVDEKHVMKQMKEDLSLTQDQNLMTFGVTKTTTTTYTFVIASVAIALLILLSGYLLINNIMRISVLKDIHYFGQLKTLGATKKQLTTLIKRQIFYYGLQSIPFGIGFAMNASYFFVPSIMETIIKGSSIEHLLPMKVSFHFIIYLFTIMFAFLTLWFSSIKPAKMVNTITAIEAMRYTTTSNDSQKKQKQSTRGGKLYKMAFRNVFCDYKKACSVFFSLFVGLFTFLCVYSAFANPDFQIRFERQQPYPFSIQASKGTIDSSLCNEVKTLQGVNAIQQIQIATTLLKPDKKTLAIDLQEREYYYDKSIDYYQKHPEEYKATLIQLNESDVTSFKKMNTAFDTTSFLHGDSILVLDTTASKQAIGQTISLYNEVADAYIEYTIANIFVDAPTYKEDASSYYIDNSDQVSIYISEKGLEKLSLATSTKALNVVSNRSFDTTIQASLEQIFHQSDVEITSQKATEDTLTPMIDSMKFGGMCFASILIIIGMLNFINVIVTSLHARQKELCTLEAIGMSKAQMKRMILYEGLYYVIGSLLAVATIGTFLSKLLVNIIHDSMYYFTYSYPWSLLMGISLLLLGICILTTYLLYNHIHKQTISQRLHMASD